VDKGIPFDGGGSFKLVFEIEEDVPEELDSFVRLSRLGLFKQGKELFDETLNHHMGLFPVVAEYAEPFRLSRSSVVVAL
jgi:hypothetical protein